MQWRYITSHTTREIKKHKNISLKIMTMTLNASTRACAVTMTFYIIKFNIFASCTNMMKSMYHLDKYYQPLKELTIVMIVLSNIHLFIPLLAFRKSWTKLLGHLNIYRLKLNLQGPSPLPPRSMLTVE